VLLILTVTVATMQCSHSIMNVAAAQEQQGDHDDEESLASNEGDAVEKNHTSTDTNDASRAAAYVSTSDAAAATTTTTVRRSKKRSIVQNPVLSFKLDSISIADRWNFILKNQTHDPNTQFAKLLESQQQTQHHQPQQEEESKSSQSKSQNSSTQDHHSFYSISWSILLTTVAIIGMTSFTSLSALLYSNSGSPIIHAHKWKDLPQAIAQTIPILLKAEFEISHQVKTYLYQNVLPTGWETLHKMLLMEMWRSVWLKTFRLLRTYFSRLTGKNYYYSKWETYAPAWLRRGVRSFFIKNVQGRLQGVLYAGVARGWEMASIGFGSGSGWWDYEIVEDGNVDGDSHRGDSDEDADTDSGMNGLEELGQESDEMDLEMEMEFENGADIIETVEVSPIDSDDADCLTADYLEDDGDDFEIEVDADEA